MLTEGLYRDLHQVGVVMTKNLSRQREEADLLYGICLPTKYVKL